MKYIDPYSKEIEIDSLERLAEVLNTDFSLWEQGSGDSLFYQQDPIEGLLMIKFKNGYFFLDLINYVSPSWNNPQHFNLTHNIGGNEMTLESSNILNESQAMEILSEYYSSKAIPTSDSWTEYNFSGK